MMTRAELTEAMARALCRENGIDPDGGIPGKKFNWQLNAILGVALAALAAIEAAGFVVVPKEPTWEMLRAAAPLPEHLFVGRGNRGSTRVRVKISRRHRRLPSRE